MKKAILWLLKDFRFARKAIGGKWYYVKHIDSGSGIAGPISYWTQDLSAQEEPISVEEY